MRFWTLVAVATALAGCSSESGTSDAVYVDAGGSQTQLDATTEPDGRVTPDATPDVAQDVPVSYDANEAATVDAHTPPVCAPGKQEHCACVGGKPGAQICKSDGSGWTPCECPEEPDAGIKDAGNDADANANLLECSTNACKQTLSCTSSAGFVMSMNGCCTDKWECGAISAAGDSGSTFCFDLPSLASVGLKCH